MSLNPPTASPPPLRNVVAMLHVATVSRAAAFYALLGFEVANTHHDPAAMTSRCGRGCNRGMAPA